MLFFPGAEVVHVGGASHGGRMYVENLRGHLRFLAKHKGLKEAERARRCFSWSLRLRALLLRDARTTVQASASSRPATRAPCSREPRMIEYLRLAFGTFVVLLPGIAVARALRTWSVAAVFAWSLAQRLRRLGGRVHAAPVDPPRGRRCSR